MKITDQKGCQNFLLEREPYFENVAKIMVLSERNHIESYISASAVTDVYYIALKVLASKTRADETEISLFE